MCPIQIIFDVIFIAWFYTGTCDRHLKSRAGNFEKRLLDFSVL